jgi:hypothetical protein
MAAAEARIQKLTPTAQQPPRKNRSAPINQRGCSLDVDRFDFAIRVTLEDGHPVGRMERVA